MKAIVTEQNLFDIVRRIMRLFHGKQFVNTQFPEQILEFDWVRTITNSVETRIDLMYGIKAKREGLPSERIGHGTYYLDVGSEVEITAQTLKIDTKSGYHFTYETI